MNHKVRITDSINMSNDLPFVLIAGPCVMESREHVLMMVGALDAICHKLRINLIFKSSFDKANRTSKNSFRAGMTFTAAMDTMRAIQKFGIPTLTDVHSVNQILSPDLRSSIDIIQIPAFLSRQTDLIKAAAGTGKVVNVKKGQWMAPWDVKHVVDKVLSGKALITERGTSFGYNRLVVDMAGLPVMKQWAPVIFDATHSVQTPGGGGDTSGGAREFVEPLARAAVSIGVAGLFLEVHNDPDNAPSDGPNMIKLDDLEQLLIRLIKYDQLAKRYA